MEAAASSDHLEETQDQQTEEEEEDGENTEDEAERNEKDSVGEDEDQEEKRMESDENWTFFNKLHLHDHMHICNSSNIFGAENQFIKTYLAVSEHR